MIKDLENKADNEKYFQSIRYLSHSLKGEMRRKFISNVAEYNIYLAAQCIMSAEKDEDYEKKLIAQAIYFARDFNSSAKSAKGFLALSELGCFETILSLLKAIKNPQKVHLNVFINIVSHVSQDRFFNFLNLVLETEDFRLIHFVILSYDREVVVGHENIKTLNKLFNLFLNNKQYGLLKDFIDKFNLYEKIPLITEESIETILEKLKSTNNLKSNILIYKIWLFHGMIEPEKLSILIKTSCSGIVTRKSVLFAIEIANNHNINSAILTAKINNIFDDIKKIERKKDALEKDINWITNNANSIVKYLASDENMLTKLQEIRYNYFLLKIKKIKRKKINPYSQKISKYIDNFFENRFGQISLDEFIYGAILDYQIVPKDFFPLLKNYSLTGIVVAIKDFGVYVDTYNSNKQNLFLHKNQISNERLDHPKEALKEGAIISFKIIGINLSTLRLNISCLDLM